MEHIIEEYKRLKIELLESSNFDDDLTEISWNEGIMQAIDNLLKDLDPVTEKMIRLGCF